MIYCKLIVRIKMPAITRSAIQMLTKQKAGSKIRLVTFKMEK